MKELRKKTFKNGVVYCLQLEDGFLVETTDTFLPYYTKDAIGRHQNKLDNNELGDRTERWMIGVSTLDGKVYRANITNVLPFEIEGKYIIEEPVIKEDKQ